LSGRREVQQARQALAALVVLVTAAP